MRALHAAASRTVARSLLNTRSPTTAAPLAKFARAFCAPPPTPPTRPSGSFLKSALKKGKGPSVVLGHDRTLHATPERAWLVRSLELKGSVHEKAMRPKELCERFALAPRDLRLLTTHGTNLAVRRGHFLFRFPPWTGAVFRDRVVLLLEKPARDGLESPHAAAADVLQAAIALDRGDAVDGLTQLQRPQIDWVHLARGYGVAAAAVDTAEDLARELADALDADGPRVIVANI